MIKSNTGYVYPLKKITLPNPVKIIHLEIWRPPSRSELTSYLIKLARRPPFIN